MYGCNGKGVVLGYNANYGGTVDVKIGCSTGDMSHDHGKDSLCLVLCSYDVFQYDARSSAPQ